MQTEYHVTILHNDKGHNRAPDFIVTLDTKPICGDTLHYDSGRYVVCGIAKSDDHYNLFVNAKPEIHHGVRVVWRVKGE